MSAELADRRFGISEIKTITVEMGKYIMNQKNIKNQNTEKLSADDIQLYRLFCILGAAILGFAGFHYISPATFSKALRYGQWVTLVLLIATVGVYCYIRLVKKPDESKRIVTSTGVAYFLIPVLLMLTCFRSLEQPVFKCMVAFGFVSLFAAIYNIFVVKKEFRVITATTLLSIITLYYASHTLYSDLEKIISIACKGLVVLIPAALLVAAILSSRSKKLKSVISDRFSSVLCIIMSAVLLICALLALIVPSAFLYIFITVLTTYVIVGVVCTIRLI